MAGGLPASGIDGLVQEIRELKRQIDVLRKATPLSNSSITHGGLSVYGGGGITIGDLGRILIESGGSVLIRDGEGRDLFYAGGLKETVPGTPQGYAVALYRLDGSTALALVDDSDSEQVQRLKLFDRGGVRILAEDQQGDGLEWPAIPIPFGGTDYSMWPAADTGTFESLADGFTYRMARRAYVSVRHTTDVSGTTGELRLMANGTQVGATLSVGFGIVSSLIGPFTVPGSGHDGVSFTLEGRVTAGTGKVRANVLHAAQSGAL